MNNDEVRQILALYRPGTADHADPDFREALTQAKLAASAGGVAAGADPELACWFKDHCSSHLSIRGKFHQIPTPPALLGRILAQSRPRASIVLFPSTIFLRAAAVVILCLGLAAFFWRSHGRHEDFAIYRTRMARTALQPYRMDLESRDLQSINAFLAQHKAPADYVLPDGLLKAQPVGCAVLQWQGNPVSMLCFHSAQPLAAGEKTDLWLFVISQSAVNNSPVNQTPDIAPAMNLTTATWTQNGTLYILAGAGSEDFLRKYF